MSTLREDFEAWHGATRALFAKSGRHGAYMNSIIQSQWAAYQAATERAAKLADEKAGRINSSWIARDIAAAIRSGGEAGS